MFNWFKKSVVTIKTAPDSKVPDSQDKNTNISSAMSESIALKDQGNALLSQGKLDEAAKCYRSAIEHNPNYAEAYTNLGVISQSKGNLNEAAALYRQAVSLNPDLLTAHQNLSSVLINMGQIAEAEGSLQRVVSLAPEHAGAWQSLGVMAAQRGDFPQAESMLRRAIELQPDYAEAHNNLGNLLKQTKRFTEAEAAYRRAIELQPDNPRSRYNLGNLLKEAKNLPEAEACYRRALELHPDYVDAHNNLGLVLMETQRLPEAEMAFRRALELKPNFAEAHNNLGLLFKETKQLPEAEVAYRRALEFKPDYVETLLNLGTLLKEIQRMDEAEAAYGRALELQPNYADAHYNLGLLLFENEYFPKAEACYRRALDLKPDFVEAHSNLGNVLTQLGNMDEAEACYQRAIKINPDFTDGYSNLFFAMSYTNKNALHCLEEARQFGKIVARKAGTHFSSWQCVARPARLRVGLVSGDLRQHPVSHFLERILSNIDPARIELFAYPTHHMVDELTARIKTFFAAWKPIYNQSDEAAARMIHADGIHILIDLSGHTANNRLPVFAWKSAPVQVTWLGYFATTGVAEIDYFIADPWTLPKSEEPYFTESIWRLPETRLCFTVPDVDVQVSPLPALHNGLVTFACFNNLAKMNDTVVTLWAKVLSAIPDSRLFLKAAQLKELSVRQNVVRRFASHSISSDRLILEGFEPRTEYLAAYHRADIALDPFPYTGGTTTAESLWMGVPVLTLAGDRLVSRQGVSLLMNAGLPEWIATDADDYVVRAVTHANDLSSLAKLRSGLRGQVLASPIFDAPRFARHFESAMESMWEKWRGQRDAE